jgi:hypothetical protein
VTNNQTKKFCRKKTLTKFKVARFWGETKLNSPCLCMFCRSFLVEKNIYKLFAWPRFNSIFNSHAKNCFICICCLCIWTIDTCALVISLRLTGICSRTTVLKMPVLVHDLFHICLLAVCTPFSNSCEDNYPETTIRNEFRETHKNPWLVSLRSGGSDSTHSHVDIHYAACIMRHSSVIRIS